MKRADIVSALLKENFSEKTLLKFSDKQLSELYDRIVNEEGTVMISKSNAPEIDKAKKEKKSFELYEKDEDEEDNMVKPEIAGDELEEKEEVEINEAKSKKKWIQKAIHKSKKGALKKALGVKKDEKIPAEKLKAAAKKGGKLGQRARFAMTLSKLHETIDEWVSDAYHPFATKNEIMEILNKQISKKGGVPDFMKFDAIKKTQDEMMEQQPAVAPPKIKPGTTEKPKTPYQPGPGKNPKPKALKEAEPAVAPPKIKPGTTEKPKTPYQPGPGKNPKPKALKENKK